MTFCPPVSLVIVSRKRPTGLTRVLSSLRFQTYANFEVVVVADAPDAGFLANVPHAKNIDYSCYEEPNISAARNIGIARAKGEIIAFCDDDAIPDPVWLEKLVQPFANPEVASAGGYVRGRNGIEFQWKALLCDALGDDHPCAIDDQELYTIIPFDGTLFAKLQGTNCAFRRDTLTRIGGFDEGIRFFLDETDVCLRLAAAGHASAFVPNAQVHHGFEASENRSANRVPKTLYPIGASKIRFLSKHAGEMPVKHSVDALFSDQKSRLLRLMVEGKCEPRDIPRLISSLRKGFSDPLEVVGKPEFAPAKRGFTQFGHTPPDQFIGIAGTLMTKKRILTDATTLALNGTATLVILFSLTSFFHKRNYDPRGFWMQTGGLFGRSKRTDTLMKVWTLNARAMRELRRTAAVFPVSEIRMLKMFRNFVLEMTKRESN